MRFSTKQPSRWWRFWNRNRAWCVPVDGIHWDRRTDEQRRRGDSVLEKQSDWRVLQALKRKGIVDADGYVRPQLLTESNVLPFKRQA